VNYPVQPIGPRSDPSPIIPVDRSRGTERRRSRDEDEQQKKGRQEQDAPQGEDRPDADGHIDVLA
jgi:hypothetical protein